MRIRSVPQLRSAIVILVLLLGLAIAGRLLHVSIGDWLLSICRAYYGEYGYLAVFVGALVEGLLVINLYLPGSSVVILGAVASRAGILNIWAVIGVASTGFLLAYVLCYVLGWYGWHAAISHLGVAKALGTTRAWMLKTGPRLICAANIHPNLGALAATTSGVLRISFRTFFLLCAVSEIAWTSFWGLIAYALGNKAVELFNSWILVPVLLVVMVVTVLARGARSMETA